MELSTGGPQSICHGRRFSLRWSVKRETLLTASEASLILGISDGHVRQLIIDGKIPAVKHGNAWLLTLSDVQKVKIHGRRGRPPKAR